LTLRNLCERRPKAAIHDWRHRVDSVEKLLSGIEAIFPWNRDATENPRKTRDMAH
jgi:hypothetical protein